MMRQTNQITKLTEKNLRSH